MSSKQSHADLTAEDLNCAGFLPIDESDEEYVPSDEDEVEVETVTTKKTTTKTVKKSVATKIENPEDTRRSSDSLTGVVFTETFDKHKLYHILQHKDEFKAKLKPRVDDEQDPFVIMEKYLAKSKNGTIRVHHFQKHGRGRHFAKDSLSLSSMPKEVRHTIAGDLYVDIDMVNAHPVILAHICKQHDIDHDELLNYIENREDCLSKLEVDREQAKKTYLAIMNGESDMIKWVKCKKTLDLKRFANEIKSIRSSLKEIFPDDYKKQAAICKKDGRIKNIDGSFMNVLMCEMENRILIKMLEFFGRPAEAVLCFDGLMLKKGTYDLRACEKYLKKELDIDMRLALKPMTLGWDIDSPDQYPEVTLSEIKQFDSQDPYVWNDFLNEYNGLPREYASYEDLCDELLPKLKRIVAFISIGKGFFVRKITVDQHMFDCCPANTYLVVSFIVKDLKAPLPLGKFIQQNAATLGYSHTVVKPDLTQIKPHEFNFWTGFRAKMVDTVDMRKIQPILDIAKNVWAAGDENVFKVVLFFLRNIVKCPEKLANQQNALVLVGDQGVGKDRIIDFMSWHVIGRQLVSRMVGVGDAVGSFNGHLRGKVLCTINEMASTREEFRSNFDKLKPYITNKDIRINQKGLDSYEVDNIASWILISNHDDIMYLEKGDRRYTCLKASSIYKGNADFWRKVSSECFNDTTGDHFYTYLMNLSDSDVMDPRLLGPTALAEEMKEMSLNSCERFHKDLIDFRKHYEPEDPSGESEDGEVEGSPWQTSDEFGSTDLFEKYKTWCSDNGERSVTHSKFSKQMESLGMEKKRKMLAESKLVPSCGSSSLKRSPLAFFCVCATV